MERPLFAPWRMDYIRSLEKPDEGSCFLCLASEREHHHDRLVLWQTDLTVVLMNRFPYTNGHLLVAPIAHKPELADLTPEELCDLGEQTARAVELLKRAISPQGFNIGMNLGRCAGAGVPRRSLQHALRERPPRNGLRPVGNSPRGPARHIFGNGLRGSEGRLFDLSGW